MMKKNFSSLKKQKRLLGGVNQPLSKCFYLLVFFLLSQLSLLAQKTVTGKVTTSSDTEGVPSVSVVLKGTTQGTITDLDGKYSISVPDENAVLQFSFVGFVTQEIIVGNRSSIDITMAEGATLNEVVVIGNADRIFTI